MKTFLLFVFLITILTFPHLSCSGDHPSETEPVALLDIQNWEIEATGAGHFLYHKTDPDFRTEIEFNSGGTEVRDVVRITEDGRLAAVVYYSGSAGTHQIVEIYRAVLLNTSTHEILGDFPWEYQTDNGLTQPEWVLSDDEKSIQITDPSSGIDQTVETGIRNLN